MRRAAVAAALATTLTAPAVASAHVTIQPPAAPAGGYARLDLRVPNERDDAGTEKVDLQLPPGVLSVSYEPQPGWAVQVRRARLDEPIKTDDGFEVNEQVDRVTLTAEDEDAIIGPGEFRDFGLSLRVPGKAGDTLTFKAVQTYESGEVVRWIGPEDSDEPAATLRLTESAGDGGHGAATSTASGGGQAQTAATAPAASTSDDGPSEGLVVAALVAGALGLLAGLAGLLTARRATARREVAA